jgi:hypothetical protein
MYKKLLLVTSYFKCSTSFGLEAIRKYSNNLGTKWYCLFLLLISSYANAATYYSRAGGTWGTLATWSLSSGGGIAGTIPGAGDDVIIEGGFTVTTAAIRACNNLTISTGATLSIGAFDFTVNGTTALSGNFTYTAVAGTKIYIGLVSINTGGIWTNTINSPVTFRGGIYTANSASFANFVPGTGLQSFTVNPQTISGPGILALENVSLAFPLTNTCTGLAILTASTGSQITQGTNGVFYFGGSSLASGLDATATGNTVLYYAAGAQTVKPVTYYNLRLRGSGSKSISTTSTINNLLYMEETATASGLPTYGTNAGLIYLTATARTAGPEWGSTFAGLGGVTIGSTGVINTGGAKTFSTGAPLTIATGATLTVQAAAALNFGGNFINNGTLTSGDFAVNITGNATQSIAGFTTTGVVASSKTGGTTATITSNMNAASFTNNNTASTIDFGTGLTHTFTGNFTMSTTSITNGGSSRIKTANTFQRGASAVFNPGTSTVELDRNDGNIQSLPSTNTSFYNILLSGSGSKGFPATITITNNLTINEGVKADLRTFLHPTNTLTLGTYGAADGKWGSFTATNGVNFKNNNFFDATSGRTGVLVVGVDTCAPLALTGVNSCKGSASQALVAPTIVATAPVVTKIKSFFNLTDNAVATRPPGEAVGLGFNDTTTCSFEAGNSRAYVATSFQVTVTGNYTFAMLENAAYDGMGYIFSGNFIPGNCTGGGTFIRGDDNDGLLLINEPRMNDVPLTAGTNYTLITTTYNTVTDGSEFTWNITPPSGGGIKIMPNWYTSDTGGSAIGYGNSFNPVGVTGSGLANTNTPGTYTYYAGFDSTGCKTPVDYVINDLPTITLAAAATSVCPSAALQTTNLAYTATTLAPTTYSITWNASPTNSFVTVTDAPLLASPISISVPANAASGTYTGNLTVKNANGCATAASTAFTITVNAVPGAGSIDVTPLSICNGGSPNVLSTGVGTGTGTITYQWESSPTPAGTYTLIPSQTGASLPITNLTTTTSYRRRTVATSTDGAACISVPTAVKTITVYAVYTNGAIATTGEVFCAPGGNPGLIGSPTPASGGDTNISYQWQSSTDLAFTSPFTIPSSNAATYDPPAITQTTYYRRQAKDTFCQNIFTSSTGVWTVTVNPLPTINGTLTACVNGTTQLTGSATPNAVNPWISGTPAVATVSNTGLVTGVSSGTSIITYTDSNGCQQTATITINALPTINGVLNVCINGTTQLTGSATANVTNPWISATPSVATVSNTGLVTGVSSGTSIITYTNSNGCQQTATVTVNLLPTISGT